MATTTKQNNQYCTTSPSIDANTGPWTSKEAYLAWLSSELGVDTPREGTEILVKDNTGAMTKYRYEVISGTPTWTTSASEVAVDSALDTTSDNPVKNKVVAAAIANLQSAVDSAAGSASDSASSASSASSSADRAASSAASAVSSATRSNSLASQAAASATSANNSAAAAAQSLATIQQAIANLDPSTSTEDAITALTAQVAAQGAQVDANEDNIELLQGETEQAASDAKSAKEGQDDLCIRLFGEKRLVDAVGYDDEVVIDRSGSSIIFVARVESTGWPNYGIKLPDSLVDGQQYTIKGTIANNTQVQLSMGNYTSLFPEDESPAFWLIYNLAAGQTATINKTFTYDDSVRFLSVGKSTLHYVGDSITLDLYIEAGTGRMTDAENDIATLQDRATAAEAETEKVKTEQDGIYTDVFGKKRLMDAIGYDSQVKVELNGSTIVLTALEESTGSPHYGLRLPSDLVNGREYTLKGTFKNSTTTPCPIGNYGSLTPDGSPNFWVAFDVAVGATAQIDLKFTYNSSYPYIAVSKSNLRYVGDKVEIDLYIEAGENILGRVKALEGDGVSNTIESVIPDIKAKDGSLLALFQSGDNTGWSYTQEANGVRCLANGSAGIYKTDSIELYPEASKEFKPNSKYAVFLDVDAEAIPLLHEQDTLGISFFFVKPNFEQNSASSYLKMGEILDAGHIRNIQQVVFVETGASSGDFIYVRMALTKMNNTATTAKICNILIKRLIIFEVTEPYAGYSELDFVSLIKNAGEFSTLAVVAAARMARANLLYDGGKLKSLGDSLPETCSFQPYIAQALGMNYSRAEETTTQQVTWQGQTVLAYKSVLGGTRVVPVIRSSAESGASMGSIYMRARSLKFYSPDVVIVLAGYNDVHAGQPYIDGGTATEPSDYGINDAPYTGGEINLLTTPSASVPSFGASYRGMIRQMLTDMPWCRIVVCGIPRGSGETSLIGTDADWVAAKNNVIKTIAEEYGLPFIDLSKVYGVNAFNYEWLTKDGLHFSDFGGKRVAQELLAKVF